MKRVDRVDRKRFIIQIIMSVLLMILSPLNVSALCQEYDETEGVINNDADYLLSDFYANTSELLGTSIDNDVWFLIPELITHRIDDTLPRSAAVLSTLLGVIILLSVVSRIQSAQTSKAASFLGKLSITSFIIIIVTPVISITKDVITNLSEVVSIITPVISSVSLLSGASYSSAISVSSLSLILTIYERVFITLLSPFSTIIIVMLIAESIYPPLKAFGITKTIKKHLISVLVFSFSFLIAIIGFNRTLAASKDSASLRGIKFVTSNIIPLIGSSVSEAMKTVTAGVVGIKSTIGITASYAIILLVAPSFITMLIQKLAFRITSAVASVLGVSDAGSILESVADVIDIYIAIITAVGVTTFFTIFLFTYTLHF